MDTAAAGTRMPIFIVDDEAEFRSMLAEFLESLGYRVRTFGSAEALLAELGADGVSPGLVISDVRMGRVSGLELARTLKRERPALPVILMTGFGGSEGARDARESGAEGYLDKPFLLDDMQALVERVLRAAA